MKYPDEFETPAFPAGKRIAVSRSVSIAVMVMFLIILFVCGMILWTQKSMRSHPFLVSIDNITGQWELVGHKHQEYQTMSTEQTLQESVITKFMQNWFWLSNDEKLNNALWSSCNRETDCKIDVKSTKHIHQCDIYCATNEETFNDFVNNVIPQYQAMLVSGVQYMLDINSVNITKISESADTGNVWQINAQLLSNMGAPVQILAYATVMKDTENYPKTMGYYIASFNTYKIN